MESRNRYREERSDGEMIKRRKSSGVVREEGRQLVNTCLLCLEIEPLKHWFHVPQPRLVLCRVTHTRYQDWTLAIITSHSIKQPVDCAG